jgi:hypothetical protein
MCFLHIIFKPSLQIVADGPVAIHTYASQERLWDREVIAIHTHQSRKTMGQRGFGFFLNYMSKEKQWPREVLASFSTKHPRQSL